MKNKLETIKHTTGAGQATFKRDGNTGRVTQVNTTLEAEAIMPGQQFKVRLEVAEYEVVPSTAVRIWLERGEPLADLTIYAYDVERQAHYTAELVKRHPLAFYVKHWGGHDWIVNQLAFQGVIVQLTDELPVRCGFVDGVRAYRLRHDGFPERFKWEQMEEIDELLEHIGGDGHSIWKHEVLDAFPVELRQRFIQTMHSDGTHKGTITGPDGDVLDKLEGVYGLTVSEAICEDLNIPYPQAIGRGFQARHCYAAWRGAYEQRRVNNKAAGEQGDCGSAAAVACMRGA